MRVPLDLPTPQEIQEEPIRPLLVALDQTARAVLLTLHAEYPDGWPDPDPGAELPLDGAAWLDHAVAVQIEGLLRLLETHARALRDRHFLRHMRSPDF